MIRILLKSMKVYFFLFCEMRRLEKIIFKKFLFQIHLHPSIIETIENIFSQLVVGETFPKPTLVKLVRVKNKAVMYLDFKSGPLSELFS